MRPRTGVPATEDGAARPAAGAAPGSPAGSRNDQADGTGIDPKAMLRVALRAMRAEVRRADLRLGHVKTRGRKGKE